MKKINITGFLLLFSILLYSQDADILNARGFRQAKKENYDKAIKLFTLAIATDPWFTEAYYNRALAWSRLKNYEQSVADYTLAINIRAHFKMAYNNRGADRNELKDYKGAIEDCTKAIEMDSTYSMAYYNRGIALLNLNEYQKAIFDFDKAIAFRPDYKEAWLNRQIAKERSEAFVHDQVTKESQPNLLLLNEDVGYLIVISMPWIENLTGYNLYQTRISQYIDPSQFFINLPTLLQQLEQDTGVQ